MVDVIVSSNRETLKLRFVITIGSVLQNNRDRYGFRQAASISALFLLDPVKEEMEVRGAFNLPITKAKNKNNEQEAPLCGCYLGASIDLLRICLLAGHYYR